MFLFVKWMFTALHFYRAESVHRMQAEQGRTGGEAGRAGSGTVGSRCLCASPLTAQTHPSKGGKEEK